MPGSRSGRQAEGVSSVQQETLYSIGYFSYPVKEVSSLAVQGAKSSLS